MGDVYTRRAGNWFQGRLGGTKPDLRLPASSPKAKYQLQAWAKGRSACMRHRRVGGRRRAVLQSWGNQPRPGGAVLRGLPPGRLPISLDEGQREDSSSERKALR